MLGQALNQILTQQRLETYLASSPDLDISGHLQRSPSRRNKTNGTNTPRDLSSRLKILELFTLHVLPRNDEWDYARSFITNSDILDEERREAFLQTLEELKDEQESEVANDEHLTREREEDRKQDYEAESKTRAAIAARQPSETAADHNAHRRSASEVDYGIESPQKSPNRLESPARMSGPSEKATSTKILAPKSEPPPPSKANAQGPRAPSSKIPARARNVRKPGRTDVLQQGRNLLRYLQNLFGNMTGNLSGNPAAIFRTLFFVITLLSVLAQGQVRDRLRRTLGSSWDKIRNTVGMGVKVSYI